jgi:hypothetical protein
MHDTFTSMNRRSCVGRSRCAVKSENRRIDADSDSRRQQLLIASPRAWLDQNFGKKLRIHTGANNRGLMRFMCFKGALNAGLFITFLSRIIKDAPNRIFLIVDNPRVHKSVKVTNTPT